ncbi:hypothetical protein F5Y18DRAFT_336932 [Xylariaceae sp. FL1019]|nr:hypothetical protein F5Y18DRAFT_336932 [Xylariaceae sp. FL1019]
MPVYSITVRNTSGVTQNYYITNDPPSLTGPARSKPWSSVISSAHCPNGATAKFEIDTRKYYAYCTTSDGKPGDGVDVSVTQRRPVVLGRANEDGSLTPGSSMKIVVQEGTPELVAGDQQSGPRGAFQFQTGNDFTLRDAKQEHFMIGYGNEAAPFALFMPQPNSTYTIQPRNIFYLSFGQTTRGSIVDLTSLGEALKIDFESLQNSQVTVVGDQTGQLVLQEE